MAILDLAVFGIHILLFTPKYQTDVGSAVFFGLGVECLDGVKISVNNSTKRKKTSHLMVCISHSLETLRAERIHQRRLHLHPPQVQFHCHQARFRCHHARHLSQ